MKQVTTKSGKSQQQSRAGFYRQKVNSHLRYLPGKNSVQVVELILPSGPRRLGSINIEGRTFKSYRRRDHILRNGNAISINEALLESNRFEWIVIYVESHPKSPFVTSTDYMLEFGSRIFYSKPGFEVQISLQLDLWGIEKARQFRKEKYSQKSLFDEVG